MNSTPDTANKYPSDELMLSWRPRDCACSICFLIAVKKALDHQREQDAVICQEISRERNGWAAEALRYGFTLAAQECADAIRHQEAKSND